MKKNRHAFSLLELLAVVVILGIIAAVVVPRVSSNADTAKQKVHAHNIATLNSAVERYFIDSGSWPSADLNELVPTYLPDGVPAVPTDSTLSYELNGSNRVVAQ